MLTAGSPIYRGYLSNVDCRWDVIAAAVDDRTPGERGMEVSSDFRIHSRILVVCIMCVVSASGIGR